MTTPRGSPSATALWRARGRAASLPASYTTNRDTTCRRRTAAEADGFVDQGFLCGAHWRLRSPATRANWRELNRLVRRNPGPFWEHPPGSAGRMVRLSIERHHHALWELTKAEVIEIAMGIAA